MIKNLALCMLIAALAVPLWAQETTLFTEANEAYKKGESFYDLGLFSDAQRHFQKTIELLLPANEAQAELLRTKAELNYAKCAVQLGLPDGEKLILDFIRNHDPDPLADQATVEVANYYYNAKDYDKAVEYYSRVSTVGMPREKKAEVLFRLGYSYFIKKQFAQAKPKFSEIKDLQTKYYYPTNYYLGLVYFFEGDYTQAIRNFRTVENSSAYEDHIPYYVAQIYFAERQYDNLIAYAEPKLQLKGLKKRTEIEQLVGQAYFEKGDFARAIPHLEYYAERSRRLRPEEFYQLGFVQYQAGKYQDAIKSFKELSGLETQIGQSANYYLADCYLRLGQRGNARTAFGNAKRLDYDLQIKEEALYNYGKLSYELKDPREAITALQEIPPTSRYYSEAQGLMGEIFLSYRDYRQALEVMNKIPNKTNQIKESYQKVAFYRALQLLQEEDIPGAKTHFNLSLQYPMDNAIRAQTLYWQADIAHREEQYNTSIQLANQFLTLGKTLGRLPDEASIFSGNYLQGYNYLKQKNYTAAASFFQEAVSGIKRNANFIRNNDVKRAVLGDATMRTGDCYFKRNQYTSALTYYDEAIDNRYAGYDYAIYQKSLIEGLRGRTTEKILALEDLANNFPNSEFADDALLQLAQTYQEIGQLNKALPPLEKLVQNYKGKSDLVNQGLLQLGLVSYNQGKLNLAINYYKQIFSNNPDANEANLALAALEEIYIDDLGQADQYFAFLETIPGYKLDNFAKDSINFKAAESQFENANYLRAVEGYTNYIRQFPNGRYLLDAYYNRGESHSVLRRYSEAFLDYEWVVGRGPSRFYLKALEKAAIIAYNHEQNFNKAFDLYTQLELASTTDDERFEAQLGALRSAYRINNSTAVYSLAGKVANNPRATQDQIATANFYLGKMAYDQKDYNSALTSFNQVVALSDNEQTAEARYLIANIYYLRRDLDRAQQLCINNNKDNSAYPYWVAKSVILLSDVLAEKGDLYNAKAVLEALLENYNEDAELVAEARAKLNKIDTELNKASRLSDEPNNGLLELDTGGN